MRKVVGRSFKISKNQARGYGYAKPGMRRNPGVTTIAAINGRGSYGARSSARNVMSGLNRNARMSTARRRLSAAEKKAFVKRMARNRSTSPSQRATSRLNIRKAQTARKSWGRKLPRGKRFRVGAAAYGRKPKARRLSAGVYVANRRKKAGATNPMAKRRRKRTAASGIKKRRRSSKRRRKTTTRVASPKRRRRRKARKGAARKRVARKTVRRRRRRTSTSAPKRRRRRHSRRAAPKRRRRLRRNAARKRTGSKRRRKATSKRRRRTTTKRRGSKRRRSTSRRRKGSGRRRKASRRGSPRRRRRVSRRVKSHMGASMKRGQYKLNRRRRHRRNGRKLFRKNGAMDVLKLGATLFAGFAAHRVLTNIFSNQVLARLLPAPTPVTTSGFDLQANKGLIASIIVGAGGAFLANKVIKNAETRKLIVGGMVASTLHGLVMSVLKAFVPAAGDMLAGPEDGTAARLSAMYGLRGLHGGASIMPRYGLISGTGEYFSEPMNGMRGVGEYFREPMNGVGEYISATAGLGTYEQNSDLFEAAAGMGSHDYQGNHIDPSGDLDRQLTIAEAAAGVGTLSPFEAAAGLSPFEAAAGMRGVRGMGNVSTVPGADTWIPGSAEPQLWAGVRSVNQNQSNTETVPAGVLQTDGGQGIFG